MIQTKTFIKSLTIGFIWALLTLWTCLAFSQSTDDFRSKNVSGTWATATDWERYNGSTWATAAAAPTSANGTITIQSGHTMTINANVTVDQVIVNGTLNLSGGNLTINNGTGTDITINGTFDIQSTAGTTTAAASCLTQITSSGTLKYGKSSSSGYVTNNGSGTYDATKTTYDAGSTFELYAINANGYYSFMNNESFSNYKFNCTSENTCDYELFYYSTTVITGDLIVQNTPVANGYNLNLANATTPNSSIGGNFTINNGIVVINAAAAADRTFSAGGNFTINSGTLEIAHTANNVAGEMTVAGNVNIAGGNVDLLNTTSGTAGGRILVSGDFTIGSSGTLKRTWAVSGTTSGIYFKGTGAQSFSSAGTISTSVESRFYYKTSGGPTAINETYNGSSAQNTVNGVVSSPISGYSNWPTSGTLINNVTINSSNTVSLTRTLSIGGNLNISSGTFNAGGYDITLSGNWSNSGIFTNGGNLVTFNGTSPTISTGGTGANYKFYNVLIAGSSGTVALSNNMEFTNNFQINSGKTLNCGDYYIKKTTNGGTFENDGTITGTLVGYTLQLTGTSDILQGSGTFRNIQIGDGSTSTSVTLGSNITLSLTMCITASATLDASATPYSITLGGDWTNSGTFTYRTGTVTFNTSADKSITSNTTFYNLTLNKSGNNLTLNAPITVTGTLTLTAGTLNNSTNNVTLGNGATISRSAGVLSAVPVFGTSVNVIYTNASPINTSYELPVSTTVLNNLTINNSATTTLNANTQANGYLTISAGSFTIPASTTLTCKNTSGYQASITGTLIVNGTLTHSGGAYNNKFIINSGGSVIVNSGAILNVGDETLSSDRYNDIDIEGGTLDIEGGTVYVQDGLKQNTNGSTSSTFKMTSGDCYLKCFGGSTNTTYTSVGWDNYTGSTVNVSGGTVHVCGAEGTNVAMIDWSSGQTTTWTSGTLSLELKHSSLTGPDNDGYVGLANQTINNITINRTGKTTFMTNHFTANGNVTISNGTLNANGSNDITLKGNWTNNDAFTASTGEVAFKGTNPQTMGGTSATTFYDLRIDNSSTAKSNPGVTFGNAGTITNILYLINGRLFTTSSNLATLTNGAYAVNAASSTEQDGMTSLSFVDGPLKKVGGISTSVTGYFSYYDIIIPIGKSGRWAPVRLQNWSGGSDATAFTFEYFPVGFGDYSVIAPLDHVSQKEYWTISQNAGPAQNRCVGLFAKDLAFSDIIDIDAGDMVIAQYNGSDWVSKSVWYEGDGSGINTTYSSPAGPIVLSNYGVTTFNSSGTYSAFTFGSIGTTNPLPIELLLFNAMSNASRVDVTWITASEYHNNYFIIQRTRDMVSIDSIGIVYAAGNSNEQNTYYFPDNSPYSGTSYYRLKQVDNNGVSKTFDWVAVERPIVIPVAENQKNTPQTEPQQNVIPEKILKIVNVYPNPVQYKLNVIVYSEIEAASEYAVYDLVGRKYIDSKVNITNGVNTLEIDMENLKNGTYILILFNDYDKTEAKIIKQ